MKRRRVSTSLALRVLTLVLVTGFVVVDVTDEAAQAHPGYDDFMQYNMWGRAGWSGALDPGWRVVNHVEFMIDEGNIPLSVSAQEACSRPQTLTQTTVIANGLPDYSVAHEALVFYDPEDQPLCTRYGILLAMLGPVDGPNATDFLSYTLTPDLGEVRAVTCGHAFVFSWHNGCTTHLTSQSQSPGGAQSQLPSAMAAYANWRNTQYPGSSANYFGGDFNMTPTQMVSVVVNPYNSALIEADDCCNQTTYPGDGRKIDYSFVPDASYGAHLAVIWSTPESDHFLLEGHFDRP